MIQDKTYLDKKVGDILLIATILLNDLNQLWILHYHFVIAKFFLQIIQNLIIIKFPFQSLNDC